MLRWLAATGLLLILLVNSVSGLSKIAFFFHRLQAENALARADLDTAMTYLEDSIFWQPDNAPSHALIGRIVYLAAANRIPLQGTARGDHGALLGKGVGAVARGVTLSPANAWIWFKLAEVYRGHQQGRMRRQRMLTTGARTATTPVGETEAPEPEGPLWQAEDRIILAATHKALELDPAFYFYYDFLTEIFWKRGFRELAAEAMRESFALMPYLDRHAWTDEGILDDFEESALAGIEQAAGNPVLPPAGVARARADFLRATDRDQEAIRAYEVLRGLGEAYHQEADYYIAAIHRGARRERESIPYLERILEQEEGSYTVPALVQIGQAHANLGEHQEAVEYLRRYRAAKPNELRPLVLLATELERAGQDNEAERLFQATVKRFPGQPEAYRRLCAYLQRQGRLAEALNFARRLQKLEPENPAVLRLIQHLEEGLEEEGFE